MSFNEDLVERELFGEDEFVDGFTDDDTDLYNNPFMWDEYDGYNETGTDDYLFYGDEVDHSY